MRINSSRQFKEACVRSINRRVCTWSRRKDEQQEIGGVGARRCIASNVSSWAGMIMQKNLRGDLKPNDNAEESARGSALGVCLYVCIYIYIYIYIWLFFFFCHLSCTRHRDNYTRRRGRGGPKKRGGRAGKATENALRKLIILLVNLRTTLDVRKKAYAQWRC